MTQRIIIPNDGVRQNGRLNAHSACTPENEMPIYQGKKVRLPYGLLAFLCFLSCCLDNRRSPSPPPSDEYGIIQGTVRDASTSIGIQNALVAVKNTSLQANTDSSGKYQIRNVAVGTRNVEASAGNYALQSRTASVAVNSTVNLDFSLTPSTTPGNTYYVSAGGNNSNPGSQEKPWASPGYGSRRLKPGDTLVILGGKYVLSQYDDDIITPISGFEDAWITIKGEEGKRPTLAGRNNLLTAVNLAGANYVRLENLEITHDPLAGGSNLYFRAAVQIIGAKAGNIILKDLYIHHIDEILHNT